MTKWFPKVEKKYLEKPIPIAGQCFLRKGIHMQEGMINIMIE